MTTLVMLALLYALIFYL